jgi:hypothetical protein
MIQGFKYKLEFSDSEIIYWSLHGFFDFYKNKTPFPFQKWGLYLLSDHISSNGLEVNDGWP